MPKTVIEVFKVEPWGRDPNETDEQYEMFKFFRETPPMERPMLLPTICAKFGVEDWQVKDTATRFRWLWRCNKYDVYLEAARTQGAVRAKHESGRTMVSFGKSLMKKAEDSLKELEEGKKLPSYRDVIEMARLAIELHKSGLTLQGVSSSKDFDSDTDKGSPAELIESAVQILAITRKQVSKVAEENVVEGEFLESQDN